MVRYQRSILDITIDSPDFAGLVIKARRMSIGEAADVQEYASLDLGDPDVKKKAHGLAELLCDVLLAWNLTVVTKPGPGEPPLGVDDEFPMVEVPLTVDALVDLDGPLLVNLASTIRTESLRLSPPLPRPSDDGEPSLAASIPMETLSPSPENSPGHE